MAGPNITPVFELTPVNAGQTFASGDTSTLKALVTAGANGTRIDAIFISTNDTTAVNLAFSIYDGTNENYIGNVQVPIGSGYTTVARVDGLTTLAPANGAPFVLKAGYILKANCVATMTSAKLTSVCVMAGDF